MKKLLLIVNPAAGYGGYKQGFAEAMQLLSQAGYVVTTYFTTGKGDATAIAAENCPQYDCVACIGGDGTLSEVIAGLMQYKDPPPLGYFPMGTANDVATTLDLPKNNCLAAAKRFIAGTPNPFDVGGFNSESYFAYIAAFGAFTEVSYATPQEQKKLLGHLAYVLQGAAALQKIESIHTRVEFDDGVIDTNLVYGSMSNSTSVAGIVRLKEHMVCLGDGISELVLVKTPDKVTDLGEIAESVLSGRFDSDKLIILHTKRAKFIFDEPIKWTRDGEDGGAFKEVELVNYYRPIELIF